MALRFSPGIMPTEAGDGIMRHYEDDEYNLEGNLRLGFDPIEVASEVPLYAVEVEIVRGIDDAPAVKHVHPERDFLVECLEDDRRSAKFVALALEKIIEIKNHKERMADYFAGAIEIDSYGHRVAKHLSRIDLLRAGEIPGITYKKLTSVDGTLEPRIVTPSGADNYEKLVMGLGYPNNLTVINHRLPLIEEQ